MGDARRFDAFASLIARVHGERRLRIADVAGGKGYLQLALRERGYTNVTTFDIRSRRIRGRGADFRWQLFDKRVRDPFDLIVGMHPDGGTDQAISGAVARGVPFVICPCCIIPSAWEYWGQHKPSDWLRHLHRKAAESGFVVDRTVLSISGRNHVLMGAPICRQRILGATQ